MTEATSIQAPSGQFEGRVHTLPVRIYYEDTDMSGIVYHANYLRYFERGRSDFLRMIGVNHAELLTRDPPLAFAITAINLAFKAPARIDDSLLVHTTYDTIQGVRLKISQTITRANTVLATADVEAVCIDLTGRPRRPFIDLVTKLAPFLAK